MQPEPDDRWRIFMGGLGDDGQPKPMTYEVFVSITRKWPVTPGTPSGIAGLLSTCRAAFELAWFHYELLVVAGTWSLLAVEAALRDRLEAGDKATFQKLLQHAEANGLLNADEVDRLDAGRELRNRLVHAREQQAWTLGMAAPIIEASHHLVGRLYPD